MNVELSTLRLELSLIKRTPFSKAAIFLNEQLEIVRLVFLLAYIAPESIALKSKNILINGKMTTL